MSASAAVSPPSLTAFLVIAYTPPDSSLLLGNEATSDRAEQARKAAERPELRIVSRAGEELAADALGITDFERWGCNDYIITEIEAGAVLASSTGGGGTGERYYMVLSPKDIVVVKPRDWRDHVAWLVERKRYEEALEEIERQAAVGITGSSGEDSVDAIQIGQRYIEHLVSEGNQFFFSFMSLISHLIRRIYEGGPSLSESLWARYQSMGGLDLRFCPETPAPGKVTGQHRHI